MSNRKRNRTNDAIRMFKRCTDIDTTYVQAHLELYRLHRGSFAALILNDAIKANPKNVELRLAYGQWLLNNGNDQFWRICQPRICRCVCLMLVHTQHVSVCVCVQAFVQCNAVLSSSVCIVAGHSIAHSDTNLFNYLITVFGLVNANSHFISFYVLFMCALYIYMFIYIYIS